MFRTYLTSYLNKQSPLRMKLASGFAWAFFAKVLVSASTIIINILLARLLPPEQVGGYFLALSVLAILSAVTSLGFKQAIVKLVSESLATGRPGRARYAIRWVLGIGAFSFLAGGVFLAFGGGAWLGDYLFDSPLVGELSGLLGIWLIVSGLQTLIAEVFRGLQNLRWASLFGGQGAMNRLLTIFLLILVWLLFSHTTLWLVILLALLSNITTLLVAFLLLWHTVGKMQVSADILSWHDLFDLAWPLWLNSLALIILNQADIVFLGALRPEGDVALYGMAMRLSLLVSMPLFILNAVLPPMISELYAVGQKQRLERLLRSTATVFFMPAISIWLLFVIFGKFLLTRLFGSFYIQAYWPLLILSIGQVINVITGSCGVLMKMSGHHKHFMWITIIVGGGELFIYPVLINLYGVVGASIASMTFWVSVVGASVFFSARFIGVKTWPYWNPKFVIHEWKLIKND